MTNVWSTSIDCFDDATIDQLTEIIIRWMRREGICVVYDPLTIQYGTSPILRSGDYGRKEFVQYEVVSSNAAARAVVWGWAATQRSGSLQTM